MTPRYPLAFIHGAGGTKTKWRSLTSQLQEDEYIAIDLPGHGSNDQELCSSIEEYGEVLANEITEPVIAVGHSMGGLIALEWAKRGENVKGIILVGSGYALPVHSSIIESLEEGTFPPFLFKASYAKSISEALLEEERKELEASPTNVALNDFIACDNYRNGRKTLESIQVPILSITGTEDKLMPPQAVDRLKEANPRVETVVIEEAGHYVQLEKPEETLRNIEKFQKTLLNG